MGNLMPLMQNHSLIIRSKTFLLGFDIVEVKGTEN